jgi:hypothetical protein
VTIQLVIPASPPSSERPTLGPNHVPAIHSVDTRRPDSSGLSCGYEDRRVDGRADGAP